MKRFHVHLHVNDLAQSIAFYAKLFAAPPTRVEADYAKWMLDDPRLNFAISTRGSQPGVDHLGLQVDEASELVALKAQAETANLALHDVGQTTCCYARSDKHWIVDPQGVAWEHFHTLANVPVFGEAPAKPVAASAAEGARDATTACCAPRGQPVGIPVAAAKSSCC